MSLVLSNAFKNVLLSGYVNTKTDLAIKSLQDLIEKPNVQIIHDGFLELIKKDESTEISKLKERIFQTKATIILNEITDNMLTKLQTGQAVILCNSNNCPLYQAFMCNLKLIYSDDHQFHSFITLMVIKSHSLSLIHI